MNRIIIKLEFYRDIILTHTHIVMSVIDMREEIYRLHHCYNSYMNKNDGDCKKTSRELGELKFDQV